MAAEKTQPDQSVLLGRRVLVVEDEYFIADDFSRMLTGAGATVIGPCGTVSSAHDAITSGGFECAVIDLNLRGESAAPVADHLLRLNIPFAIATGYGSLAVPEHLRGIARFEKPFDPAQLVEIVGMLTAEAVS